MPLTEQEEWLDSYLAVSGSVAQIRSADLIRRWTDNREMNLEEIKQNFAVRSKIHENGGDKDEAKISLASYHQNWNQIKTEAFCAATKVDTYKISAL